MNLKNFLTKKLKNFTFLQKFPWRTYLAEKLFEKFKLNENETLIVDNWNYIAKVVDIYSSYSEGDKKRTLNNFLLFDFFEYFSASLPDKYLEAQVSVKKVCHIFEFVIFYLVLHWFFKNESSVLTQIFKV